MSNLDLRGLLDLAERAAARAASALLAERATWSIVEAEEGREVKLRADRHAEALIVETLHRSAPYRILSEEAGWIAGGEGADADLMWAVDPLDGSVNYAHGFPHWAVSIALVRAGTPVLGVVHCPALGEIYSGAVRLGVYDAMGRLITTYLDEVLEAGEYRGRMNVTGTTPGVYFLRLTTPEGTQSRRFVLIR